MLEILILIILLFLIAFFFYKQRRSETQILQMEFSQRDEQLADLLEEQQPLVIRGVSPPRGITQEDLEKIPRLANFAVGGQPLERVLKESYLLFSAEGKPVLSTSRREQLAQELSVPVWAKKLWEPFLAESVWFGSWLGTTKTEVIIGGLGLFRTTAYYTMFFPTEETYNVSIISKESEDYLPPAWNYRYLTSFTINDTPLINELKYLDVVVRPGTAICIPRHTVISLEPNDPISFSAGVLLEFHMPVSLLAKEVG